MTKTLIKNIDVITLDEAGAVLRNSHIAIDGKRILSVGDVPIDFTPDETLDGYNHVVVPAFFNARRVSHGRQRHAQCAGVSGVKWHRWYWHCQ